VEYSYDAWGKLLDVTDSTGDAHIGQKNPFLYRGYYYDSETGLYYLNSRYYDPQTGRFTQLNTGSDLISSNLFTYCGNNPINRIDSDGTLFKEVGDFFGNLWNGYLSYRQSNDKAVEEMQIQFAINQANNEAAIAKRWVVF